MGMIFDTFSSRPYAHRYLKEKRKELGNKRIIGLDSEMIYKEYYDLKEIEQDHKETNATLMSELAKLEEENESLKEDLKGQENLTKSYCKSEQDYKSRCEKASEFIKEKISSTKGVINDYMYHKEHNQHLIELLNEDIEMYKNELNILQNGSEKE